MVLRLIIATLTFTCFVAHADNLTNSDAAVISGVSGLVQAGLATKAGMATWTKSASKIFSQNAVPNPLFPRALEDVDIQTIVRKVNATWFPYAGIGQVGGAEIEVVYDATQAEGIMGAATVKSIDDTIGKTAAANEVFQGASSAEQSALNLETAAKAKPVFKSEFIYPRVLGSDAVLKTKLEYLKEKGALIREVPVRGLITRAGMQTVSAVATLYFVSTTASNVYRAYEFSNKSARATTAGANAVTSPCQGTDANNCQISWFNVPKLLWNTSDYVFYKFYANQ